MIIPIYNGEKYIRRLFNSLLEQTYKNLQIIIIDDGSTDKTQEICNEYVDKFNDCLYIHKDNGGVSSARNLGIKYIKGQYVSFIDCDDKLEKDYFEKLVCEMKAPNIDLAMCGINEISATINQYGLNEKLTGTNRNSDLFVKLFNNYWFPVLWNKMYRASIIINNNIKFNENISYDEDTLFNFDYYCLARKISLLPDKLYNYYINTNSLTNKGAENIFYNSIKTINQRLIKPKELFGENSKAIFISAKKILKAVLQESKALLTKGENISYIIKIYKKRLRNKYVKQATRYLTALEDNFNEYHYYYKIFKEKNTKVFCKYIMR